MREVYTHYTPIATSKRDKIIGLQDADLIHKLSDTGDGAGGFTETTFDVNSKAGQAKILLRNEMGSSKKLVECAIVGAPVYQYEGDEGYINDGHIDYTDIAKNGERLLEFGGSDVIDGTSGGQLDKLADFLWKDRGKRKHVYSLTFTGSAHDISPSDVYTINIGSAGETEYITSRAEVMTVRIEHRPGSLGATQVTLRELEEAWKYDSSIISRFNARGVLVQSPSTGAVVTVGSEYCTVGTDYRVEIGDTSAEDVINSAIDYVSGSLGGGTVLLIGPNFNIDGAIDIPENVMLDLGGATITKNCNDYGIKCVGGAGTEVDNAGVRNGTITRDASDTNSKELLYLSYADDFTLGDISIKDAYYHAVTLSNCDRLTGKTLRIIGVRRTGLNIISGGEGVISDFIIDGESTAQTTDQIGLALNAKYDIYNGLIRNLNSSSSTLVGALLSNTESIISGLTIKNIDQTNGSNYAFGALLSADRVVASNVLIEDIDNTAIAANSRGFELNTGSDDNFVSIVVTGCSGTGLLVDAATCDRNILAGRSTNNGTNLTDNGTNTNTAAFDSN